MKEKIIFPEKSIDIITEKVHKKIDYDKIADTASKFIPKPLDGKDGQDLILTEAVRADVIDTVAQLVPRPMDGKDGKDGVKGKDFQALDNQQLSAIAQQVLNDLSVPEGIKDAIIEEIVGRALFVTQTRFNKQMKSIEDFIKRSKKRTIHAGISGGDMVAEIDKAIGQNWRSDDILVNQQSDNYQAILTDNNKVIEFANAAADFTFTIPPNSTEKFPIGAWMEVRKTGAGEITIARGGIAFRSNLGNVNVKIDGADGFSIFIEKTALDIWLISGAIKAV